MIREEKKPETKKKQSSKKGIITKTKSTIKQTHRTICFSLRDIDSNPSHILELFLQEPGPHQLETSDHKHIDSKLVGATRLMT